MDKTVRTWAADILRQRSSLTSIAAVQRAKFEGWLKFELADRAIREGATDVQLEAAIANESQTKHRSDIYFCYDDTGYHLELKTANSNWKMPGVSSKTRPITKNFDGIIADGRKLLTTNDQGLVLFVLFPIPPGDDRWREYLQRVSERLKIPLSEHDHCSRVLIPVRDRNCAELIVCCFRANATSSSEPL